MKSKNKPKKIIKLCPECGEKKFKYDSIHQETYCENCGLIINAPPEFGIIFPGYMLINLKKEVKKRWYNTKK